MSRVAIVHCHFHVHLRNTNAMSHTPSSALPKVRSPDQFNSSRNERPIVNAAPATPRMLRNASLSSVTPQDVSPKRNATLLPGAEIAPTQPQLQPPSTPKAGATVAGAAPQQFHRKSIGDWVFAKTIGSGSMGKVKVARHRITQEVCAVKVVPRAAKIWQRQHAHDPMPTESTLIAKRRKEYEKEVARDTRTVREGALGKLLYHPYICRLYEMIPMTNHYYMLFEYVTGGQMLDYIVSHGSLKERHARRFARGIASALEYCHSNNVVHRDLKVENIMITMNGEIKLIDFGLSNLYDRRQLLKTYCGSLYFAAPELLRAHPYVGPEVDVWSFGVVLYVLVSGKVPFDDQSVNVLHEKIKRGTVEYPPFISHECVSLLSRMLVVDPLHRATVKEVMRHPWMCRGYDGPPQSYLPYREPLQLPLDIDVVRQLTSLELGSEERILTELTTLLSSDQYVSDCRIWNRLHSMSQSDDQFIDTQFNQYDYRDPTDGYHPILSMYFLASEAKRRRSGKSIQYASEKIPAKLETKMETKLESKSEPLEFPKPAYTSPRQQPQEAPSLPHHLPTLDTSHRNNIHSIMHTNESKSNLNAEDSKTGINSLLRRFSSRRKHPVHPSPPTHATSPTHQQQVPTILTQESSPTPSRERVAEPVDQLVRRVGSMKVTSREKNPAQTHQRTSSAHVGAAQLPPPSPTSKKYHPSARAKSVGHGRKSSLNPRPPAPPVPAIPQESFFDDVNLQDDEYNDSHFEHRRNTSVMEKSLSEAEIVELSNKAPQGSMPSIEYPRTLFLKGFFSVQTTSTKPLPVIRYNIITVLVGLGVKFKEVKGGFICVHTSSIETKEEISENSEDTPKLTVSDSHDDDSMPRRRFSLGNNLLKKKERSSSFHSEMPMTPASANVTRRSSTDSQESMDSTHNIRGGSDMLVSSRVEHTGPAPQSKTVKVRTPLKFEIHIVKVPLVGLYGIQLKKVTGNAWMYKTLAGQILSELNL